MKFMSLVAILLMSLSASAYRYNRVVYHDYNDILGPIELDNACVTANHVRTIEPMRWCAHLTPHTYPTGEGGSATDWKCDDWRVSNLSQPRTIATEICTKYRPGHGEIDAGGCEQWSRSTKTLPQTINIRVVFDGDESSNYPGVQKRFTFPTCRDDDDGGQESAH